ncbi:undecaprenyl-diphosphate phosphatase [Sphingomonas montanisoli]|uniref:Undecaprenyl-diphosphatase n=1 Tax=Sphingomonas montanisoli TaxID=2606412 RepID=A0A5D9C3F4_9SPHN|nr:undecaprenyl-diphosphate phosphatase [Sphingomonas montanisoli]TZG24445.1 undecaprenyl-diphosphate phosphatase [Sphingomonas montanisoli]
MTGATSLFGPVILGIVEGLTEFIPVSSTGHLILAEQLIGYRGAQAGIVEVVIQVGAILAICWLYRARLWSVARGLPSDSDARRFARNVMIAVVPTVIVGGSAHDFIKTTLFSPHVVAVSLTLGGAAIVVIERWAARRTTEADVEHLSASRALGVGFCQLLSLIPGVSRSGATIMGGLAIGIDRKTATEFSFFLAIPTMFGAAALDLFKNRDLISAGDMMAIVVGTIVSFLVAIIVVKWLVEFVGRHGFTIFGWYRIGAGVVALALLNWH